MSRLERPYIPVAIRRQVAERQIVERGIWNQSHVALMAGSAMPDGQRLAFALDLLFGKRKYELHHRPSLVNRPRKHNGDYDPPANDPNFLIYLADDDHDVETRVRGLHGQYSDLALARKNKRIARNRDPKRRKAKIHGANRWPPRGSQKIQNRRKP